MSHAFHSFTLAQCVTCVSYFYFSSVCRKSIFSVSRVLCPIYGPIFRIFFLRIDQSVFALMLTAVIPGVVDPAGRGDANF